MPHNEYVQKFISIIGPFYEYVNDNNEPIRTADNQSNGFDHLDVSRSLTNQLDENYYSSELLITKSMCEAPKLAKTLLNGDDNKHSNATLNGLNGATITNGKASSLTNGNGVIKTTTTNGIHSENGRHSEPPSGLFK
jgi:hypothetical protein